MIQKAAVQLTLPPADASAVLFSDRPRRTDLPHLTEIIEFHARELGEAHPSEANGGFSKTDLAAYAENGFLWETLLTAAWKQRMWSRGLVEAVPQEEIEADGILMTPDFMSLKDWVLIEAKSTTRSRNKWDQYERYFWRWMMQVKGYARTLNTRRVHVYVWWVCGTWKPPVPEAWRYELEFGKAELDENWALVLKTRDRLLATRRFEGEGKGGK